MAFTYTPPTRIEYVVRVEMKPGVLTEIYRGANRSRAVDICNFWDERVNSYFEEVRPPRSALDVANAKFDALEHYIRTGENL